MADSELVESFQLELSHRTKPNNRFEFLRKRGIKWAREKELGRGSFGVIWLEKGGDGEQRALKVIEKKYLPSEFDYKRELLAMAKLSKVLPPCFIHVYADCCESSSQTSSLKSRVGTKLRTTYV